jgi:hypothetical protein
MDDTNDINNIDNINNSDDSEDNDNVDSDLHATIFSILCEQAKICIRDKDQDLLITCLKAIYHKDDIIKQVLETSLNQDDDSIIEVVISYCRLDLLKNMKNDRLTDIIVKYINPVI